jgi:hypothetical protein
MSVSSSTDYPSVGALEKELLGTEYRLDPIRSRLDRLELKAFRKTSPSSDLSYRVSELKRYAVDNNYAKPDEGSTVTKYVPPPPATASLADKVAWLEEQVYGRAVPDRSIYQRVRRLNLSVLPKDFTDFDGSVPENVSTLISAVELDQGQHFTTSNGQSRYQKLPDTEVAGAAHPRPKLNSTAAALQQIGMPGPLKDSNGSTAKLNLTNADEDDDDANAKKKKKHGFWHALKQAMDEGVNDPSFGPPRYAYGDLDWSR